MMPLKPTDNFQDYCTNKVKQQRINVYACIFMCMCASEGFVMNELKMVALIQLKREGGAGILESTLRFNSISSVYECMCVYMRVCACICLYMRVNAEIFFDLAGKHR